MVDPDTSRAVMRRTKVVPAAAAPTGTNAFRAEEFESRLKDAREQLRWLATNAAERRELLYGRAQPDRVRNHYRAIVRHVEDIGEAMGYGEEF